MLTFAALASGLAYGQSCPNLPAGAAALGYNTLVFYDQPQLSEISETDTGSSSKWYPGSVGYSISSNLERRENISNSNGELALGLDSGVSSETQSSEQGLIPWLSGAKGFYVEFAMHMSDNDTDHFIGLYLQTAEHDLTKSDHLPGDPAGFERWTELDVSETGYGGGSMETLHDWSGTYPNYVTRSYHNYGYEKPLDFTVEHRYGMSYDPASNTVQWYIDDLPSWKSTEADAAVMQRFHYYIVMEANSHGGNKPYNMYIRYVKAYSK
jgi:hypothetical protein